MMSIVRIGAGTFYYRHKIIIQINTTYNKTTTTMMFTKKVTLALAAAVALSASAPTSAFSTRNTPSLVQRNNFKSHGSILQATNEGDTDLVLPSFETKEDYTAYLLKAGKLPGGFAVGTAKGSFVSVEAPAIGPLPIKATVIHLTEGPAESWAAVFTSNRVRFVQFSDWLLILFCYKCGFYQSALKSNTH